MSLRWFSRSDESPPQQEIEALGWKTGEDLALQLFQVADEADRGKADDNHWFQIKTNLKITPVAWSDNLSVGIYILSLRRGYYASFSWDRSDVTVLSVGRARDKASEIQAIELALRRCEQSMNKSSDEAKWRTNLKTGK